MSKYTSVILGEHYDAFIKEEITAGRYASVSEMIRAGLRLLEAEHHKIRTINEALVVGEKSGVPVPFDNEAFKARMREAHDGNT